MRGEEMSKVAIVTGSSGLIGSQVVRQMYEQFDRVIGIDNDMRSYYFGEDASTKWNEIGLTREVTNFESRSIDIRDKDSVDQVFDEFGTNIHLVVHTAAQPSHDWAAREPHTDFAVNATGTLNLLESTRTKSPEAVFIFTSTNKVYGDRPNSFSLVEQDTRWALKPGTPYAEHGFDETLSIDQSKHSLFGASKVAADIMVQEYGRYFDLKTGVFRGGCLTGAHHSGAMLHGFLNYLMKCTLTGRPYTIFGYKGKQVRDNIHARDLVSMFQHFYSNPRPGEVYNAGGSTYANVSMLEAIELCQEISGKTLSHTYSDDPRAGDHIWYISDVRKFESHYPEWTLTMGIRETLEEMHDFMSTRYNK